MSSKVCLCSKVPALIQDAKSGLTYRKERYFGKGSTAACYEVVDTKYYYSYAVKAFSKEGIAKHNKEKYIQDEISVLEKLNHINVVKFNGYFEDNENLYILLEVCNNRSLREMSKRRIALLEGEVRYYMHQILQGLLYLHQKKVTHQNLKLENILLDYDMTVKISNFHRAFKIHDNSQRRHSKSCAAELFRTFESVRAEQGFEADIWAVGCIMHTLLLGKEPIESDISGDAIVIPSHVSKQAGIMLTSMLQLDPKKRRTVEQLLNYEFFTYCYIPKQLPRSCLSVPPRKRELYKPVIRPPLRDIGQQNLVARYQINVPPHEQDFDDFSPDKDEEHFCTLRDQLSTLILANPNRGEGPAFHDENTDPASRPPYFIMTHTGLSEKCGFGYKLNDGSIGVLFNDSSNLIFLSNGMYVQYVSQMGRFHYYTIEKFPNALNRKMEILCYIRRNLNKSSTCTCESEIMESDSLCKLPYVTQRLRFSSCIMMLLSSGCLQVDFRNERIFVLCPYMAAVTYINVSRQWTFTYSFSSIERNGCNRSFLAYLMYISDTLKNILKRNEDRKPDRRLSI